MEKKKHWTDHLAEIDWISTAFEIGIALFILVSFVRCAFKE